MVFSTLKCGCGLMDIYKTLKTESHFWLQGGERSLFLPLFYQEFIKHDNLTRLTNVHLWPWGKNFLCPTQKSPRRAWVFWGSGSERSEVKLEGAKRWKECNHSPRAGGALRVASPLPRTVIYCLKRWKEGDGNQCMSKGKRISPPPLYHFQIHEVVPDSNWGKREKGR